MSIPNYSAPKSNFQPTANPTISMLNASNSLTDAISNNMMAFVNIYLNEINMTAQLADFEKSEIEAYMKGGVSDYFDDNNGHNDKSIWDDDGGDPDDDSKRLQLDQTDISNIQAWCKQMNGSLTAMTSSGTSNEQVLQKAQEQVVQNAGQLVSLNDYTANLITQISA